MLFDLRAVEAMKNPRWRRRCAVSQQVKSNNSQVFYGNDKFPLKIMAPFRLISRENFDHVTHNPLLYDHNGLLKFKVKLTSNGERLTANAAVCHLRYVLKTSVLIFYTNTTDL